MALIIINHIEGKINPKPDQMTIENQSVYEILSYAIQQGHANKNQTDNVK